jgi:putative nucleotidyltransferase with HDIG domain
VTDPTSSGAAAPAMRAGRPVRPGEVLRGLARARRTLALYGADHPVTARTANEAHAVLSALLALRPILRIFVHDDAFYVGSSVQLEESLRLAGLIVELHARQIGTIEFHAGLDVWELLRLAEVLNLQPAELARRGGATALLQQWQVRHVATSATRPALVAEGAQVDPRDVYRAGLRVVDDLYFQASRDAPVDLKRANIVVTSLVDALTADRSGLLGIAALKIYDEDTAHHAVNVAALSLLVAMQLGLERRRVLAAGLAGLLHDVGKVRLPRGLVGLDRPPTPEERRRLRQHTLYGAHLLRNLPGISRLAMVVAFEHHANYNRSGYPAITAKAVPHQFTRIVQVADFYDSTTATTQVWRRRLLPSEAIRHILDHAGGAFDPVVAQALVQAVGAYPVGSVVELSTGELGVVTAPPERESERPVVKIVRDARRVPSPARTVALEEDPALRIVRALDPAAADLDVAAVL